VEALLNDPKSILIALWLMISEVSWVYVPTVFVVTYGTSKLGIPKRVLLNAVFVAAALELVTMPLFGWLSDVYGHRALYFSERRLRSALPSRFSGCPIPKIRRSSC
jgi:MFS transporter, MHS family, shikimate and dehydroshikimate transport protein